MRRKALRDWERREWDDDGVGVRELALELWQTGIAEARIVAAMIDDPKQLTWEQMEDWVKDINS